MRCGCFEDGNLDSSEAVLHVAGPDLKVDEEKVEVTEASASTYSFASLKSEWTHKDN